MPEDSTAMSRATPGARRTARHAVAALALAAASLLLYLSNGRPSVGGDALPAELLPVSLLREGDFDYDEFAPELREGYMYARVNDRTISFYPVVPGLLNVPAHWLAGGGDADLVARRRELAKTTAATLTALSVGCVYLALAAVCLRWTTALLLAGFYAVGTLTWSVASNALWQHGPSLLLLSAGMACFLSRRPFWMAAAGFLAGPGRVQPSQQRRLPAARRHLPARAAPTGRRGFRRGGRAAAGGDGVVLVDLLGVGVGVGPRAPLARAAWLS
jgi:hypothetical protein